MSDLKLDTIEGRTSGRVTNVGYLDRQIASAWVNFNGTGTVVIRDSYNVSSITDNGTGDYTVNFTTAMANVNYVVTTAAQLARIITGIGTISTSSVQLRTYDEGTGAYFDANPIFAAIFGGQA